MNLNIPTITMGTAEKQQLVDSVAKFSGKKIMIIGDVGVDEYIMGEVRRISPEAPVPVVEVESEDSRLGLSANVAQNVKSLGGDPLLISVVGTDAGSEILQGLLKKSGVGSQHLIADSTRPTTRKARVMAKHHHMLRVDYEVRSNLSADCEKKVLAKIQEQIPSVDAVILEDYAKGVFSKTVLSKIVDIAKAAGKKIFLDPHRSNTGDYYSGVDLIKPNLDEAIALAGMSDDQVRYDQDKIIEVGKALQKKTGAKQVVITRGKDGMIIFSYDQVVQVPTYARQVFDVTGAGDTVIATIALAQAAGLTLEQSCQLANFAAGVVVGQVGCVPCTVSELKSYILSAN